MKKFALLSSVVLSGALLANQVQANGDFASGLYIAPGINGLVVKDGHKDNDPNIANMRKNKPGANLSFGYQFDNPWAVEFMYQYNKPRVRNSDEKVKINYGHIDGLYTFNWWEGTGWAPYVVAGIGRISYDTKGFDLSGPMLNYGIGVKYAFTDKFQLRLDGRGLTDFRHGDNGVNVNLALVYVFGKHYSSNNSKKTTQATQTTEPVVKETAPEPIKEATVVTEVVRDSDGDGVPDHLDQCADSKPGAKVDENGCYIILTENRQFTLNVTFASGSSNINESSKGDVRDLAQFLTEYPNTQATIEGHSDNTGSAALNKRLSQARADAVKQSLVNDFGIDEARIDSIGYGIEQPIADNNTAEGRAQNRRVVAQIMTQVSKIAEQE